MMDRRYQVFISSTFEDLKEERQAVLKAILELDHMPAGMELFPATDDEAWQLIRDVIDASDYYVVVIGGRYGSIDETGLSYTEKEYDYAVAAGKPVIPLLHKDPQKLPRGQTETNEQAWLKLRAFAEKVESVHHCGYWGSAAELRAEVIVGLTSTMKRKPATGWVRADQVPEDATKELLALRTRIDELESGRQPATSFSDTSHLAHGDDTFVVRYRVRVENFENDTDHHFTSEINPTWDELFTVVAPQMVIEVRDPVVRSELRSFMIKQAKRAIVDERGLGAEDYVNSPDLLDKPEDVCVIQFRALGLITESQREARPQSDPAGPYWTLTAEGDRLMTRLLAVHREDDGQQDS